MSFLYPAFLIALASLAIPVLIHLFNFRRYKRVQFSNVRFIKDVKEETRSRSRIKHLLTLLMRLLALAFLVFAFAQPYIPSEGTAALKGDQAVSIYIDNSFSMEGEGAEGRLLDLAKEEAIRIVESYDPTDRFQLVTNEASASEHRFYSQQAIIERIEDVEAGPYTENASRILAQQKEGLHGREETGRIFFLSDLQRSVMDPENFESAEEIPVYYLPFNPEQERNLYIDSVWFETPVRMLDQEEKLGFRLRNSGSEEAQDIPVELMVNGEKRAVTGFDIPADGKKDTALHFTHSDTGIHHADLHISDHPIAFDDHFYFSYRVAGSIPVLRIAPALEDAASNDSRDPLGSVFEEDPLFSYRSERVDNIDHSRLDQANLIVLDRLNSIPSGLSQELRRFIEEGGSVGLIPAMGIEPELYNEFLGSVGAERFEEVDSSNVRIRSLNTEHHFYKDVFQEVPENVQLPETNFHYRINERVRSQGVTLMDLRNGSPFFRVHPYEKGKVYLFSSPPDPDASGLIGNAILPTTLLRMAELSQPSEELYRTIGEERGISLRGYRNREEEPLRLQAVDGDLDLIPEQQEVAGATRIHLRGRIEEAGNYEIVQQDEPLRGIGVNYSRDESDLDHFSREEFQEALDAVGEGHRIMEQSTRRTSTGIEAVSQGQKLWWYCIIFALLFFGLETLILAFPRRLGLES